MYQQQGGELHISTTANIKVTVLRLEPFFPSPLPPMPAGMTLWIKGDDLDGSENSTLTDGGLEWVSDAVLSLRDNLKYTGKLTVFKALFFSEKDNTPNDYWKAIDINWENQIDAQITKVITVSLYTQVLYDKEISLKGRFKETLGIGFKYSIF